jgi:two-component system chemotaxis response regulator CheB
MPIGAESLEAAQAEALEEALAAAVRTHHDRRMLFRKMEQTSRAQGMLRSAERWAKAAEAADRAAALIATAAEVLRHPSPDGPSTER